MRCYNVSNQQQLLTITLSDANITHISLSLLSTLSRSVFIKHTKSNCSNYLVESSTHPHSKSYVCPTARAEPNKIWYPSSKCRFCLHSTSFALCCADKAWSILVHIYENSCPAFIICHFCLDSTHSLPTLVLCNCTFDGNVLASGLLSARTGPGCCFLLLSHREAAAACQSCCCSFSFNLI